MWFGYFSDYVFVTNQGKAGDINFQYMFVYSETTIES